MKKIIFLVSAIAIVAAISCNNSSNNSSETSDNKPKTKADSLMQDIMDGHDASMAKMDRLSSAQKQVQNAIDSIEKLHGAAKQTTRILKTGLDSTLSELKSAEDKMNQWMDSFNMDSSENNMPERIKYLESEKMKVTAVKEGIYSALHKADSLLKH